MQLAFSKPTSTNLERETLFKEFRSVGFDGLQLKSGQYSEFISEPERFVEMWNHFPGIASALIVGGSLDEAGQHSLRKLFKFAEIVGSERIIFCHGLSRKGITTGDIKQFAEVLSELGQDAQQHGTQLSLHHHYDQPVMHYQDLEVFFNVANTEAVKLTVDTAHLVKSGIHDVAGVIRDFKHVIDNFHLKDFEAGEWQVLGRGSIDFGPIFTAINEIGYDGWLSADEESGSGLTEAMHTCFAFMTSHLIS